MPSAWVQHVKDFAAANNLSYGCAMSDPKCKSSYQSKKEIASIKSSKMTKLDKIKFAK